MVTLISSTSSTSKVGIYSLEEVNSHNSKSDGWIIIEGFVYNVSHFLALHPGGEEIMLPYLGKDATDAFTTKLHHKHSKRAWKMLNPYKIGHLDTIDPSVTSANELSESEKKLNNLFDVTKPMVKQITMVDPPALYNEWMHKGQPVATIRLFEYDFMEKLSHYPWWVIFPLVRKIGQGEFM